MKTYPNDMVFPSTNDDIEGLTKLEYMATHIAAGLCADPELTGDIASVAVYITSKLIKELNKEEIK